MKRNSYRIRIAKETSLVNGVKACVVCHLVDNGR